jgi:hypothetical protein
MVRLTGGADVAGLLEHSASFDLCDDVLDKAGRASPMTDYDKSLYNHFFTVVINIYFKCVNSMLRAHRCQSSTGGVVTWLLVILFRSVRITRFYAGMTEPKKSDGVWALGLLKNSVLFCPAEQHRAIAHEVTSD